MADIALGIRLKADGSGLVGEVKAAEQALQGTANAAQRMNDSLIGSRAAGEQAASGLGAVRAQANSAVEALKRIYEAGKVELGKMVEDGSGLAKGAAIAGSIAIGGLLAGTIAGVIYAGYKVIKGTIAATVGLFTGETYKSTHIDALKAANSQTQEFQSTLGITAYQAQAMNLALEALDSSSADYSEALKITLDAMITNRDALDHLKVEYKNADGSMKTVEETLESIGETLDEYSKGLHRNAAAQSLGFKTANQVAAANSLVDKSIETSMQKLREYTLLIGSGSQDAVERYKDAMREFEQGTKLTSRGFSQAIADNIMPILTDLAEFFKEGFPFAVRAFRYSMATVTSLFYGLKVVVYSVTESILAALSALGSGLAGVARGFAKAFTGDFKGAWEEIGVGGDRAKQRLKDAWTGINAQAKSANDAMKLAWNFDGDTVKSEKGDSMKPRPKKERPEATGTDLYAGAFATLGGDLAKLRAQETQLSEYVDKVERAKTAEVEFQLVHGRWKEFTEPQKKTLREFAAQIDDYSASITQLKLANESILSLRQETAKARVETDFINAQGVKKPWTKGEQTEFDLQEGKYRQLQDLAKIELLRSEANKADRAIAARDIADWQADYQRVLDSYAFETGLLRASAVEQQKLTEARKIDLEVKERSAGKTQEEIGLLNTQAAAMKGSLGQAIEERYRLERDGYEGLKRASRDYMEQVTNEAQNNRDAYNRVAGSIEDMFVKGEFKAKSFFGMLQEELRKLAFRKYIAPAINGGMDSLFGGLFGGGGSVSSGSASFLEPEGGGGIFGFLGNLFASNHTGGIVGRDSGPPRMMSAAILANAQRYHLGGLAGDEVPTVLQRGEGVFTKGQMAALGAGLGGGGGRTSIVINNYGDNTVTPRETTGPDGARMIELTVRPIVRDELLQQRRNGGLLAGA